MIELLFINNDCVIRLNGLNTGSPVSYVNDATVTVTLYDLDDNVVSNTTSPMWPLTMAYVSASDGDYEGTLTGLSLTVHKEYIAVISVNASGTLAEWRERVLVKYRQT